MQNENGTTDGAVAGGLGERVAAAEAEARSAAARTYRQELRRVAAVDNPSEDDLLSLGKAARAVGRTAGDIDNDLAVLARWRRDQKAVDGIPALEVPVREAEAEVEKAKTALESMHKVVSQRCAELARVNEPLAVAKRCRVDMEFLRRRYPELLADEI